MNKPELIENLRNLEAALAVAIDNLEKGTAIDEVLSDLEEVAHALNVRVREIEIFVEGSET